MEYLKHIGLSLLTIASYEGAKWFLNHVAFILK
jgi:hypothetical protein